MGNAKYQLESFTYKSKQEINDAQNRVFLMEEEHKKIMQAIQESEAWLNSDGFNSTFEEYSNRFFNLNQAANIFFDRKNKLNNTKEFIENHHSTI